MGKQAKPASEPKQTKKLPSSLVAFKPETTVAKRTRKPKTAKDPENRTIVDIISDTRSGVPIPASENTKFARAPKKIVAEEAVPDSAAPV